MPNGRRLAKTLLQAVEMELVCRLASLEDTAAQVRLKQTSDTGINSGMRVSKPGTVVQVGFDAAMQEDKNEIVLVNFYIFQFEKTQKCCRRTGDRMYWTGERERI